MSKRDNLKFEIFVDGKNIYDGDPVDLGISEEEIVINTQIGKTKKQKLKIIIKDMNYVEPIEESTDKN